METTTSEPSMVILPKHQLSWEQNRDIRLKSESVAPNLHAQIAQLVKTRVSWPGTRAGMGVKSHLGQALGIGAM